MATRETVAVVVMAGLALWMTALPVQADVFNMGPGLTSLDMVRVGDAGNVGELSGDGAGGRGPDRVCGAVPYTYNIGRYEVTAGQYTEFLNKVAATDTYGLYNTDMWADSYGCKIERDGSSGSYTYSVASDYANRPVNFVSWGDAARFTNWLHNGQPRGEQDLSTTEDGSYYLNGAMSDAALLAVTRKSDWRWAIPSEDEWYKAAYYNPAAGSYFDYPTSSSTAPGQDMADVSGNNANYHTSPYVSPIDSGTYYHTVVGEFQNSGSPYGTFDQGGNVWEWNEAILYGKHRALRGGFFDDDSEYLLASVRAHYGCPTDEDMGIGFRVSAVPEPGTICLVALGGLAALRKRKPRA